MPTVTGLSALAQLPSFGNLETISACKTLFATIELIGRPQGTRYLVYAFLDVLMANQRTGLKRMGKEFITGYCKLVTGEKDPRNLRTAFSLARVILIEFDIAEHVEVGNLLS